MAQDKTFDWKKATGGQKQETIPGYRPAAAPRNASGSQPRVEPEVDQPPTSGASILGRLVAAKAYAAQASLKAFQAVGFTVEQAFQLTLETCGPTGTSLMMRFEQGDVVWDFHKPPEQVDSPEALVNGADEDVEPLPF